MLAELHVKNLAVIEDVRVAFGPGLSILSGDEGAGKSLVVDALVLLLGGRASANLVRSATASALVEGVFWTTPGDNSVASALTEAGLEPEADGSLILAREVQEQGRSIARVNGRAVPVSVLRSLGQVLMDIHSQMEHLSLLVPQRQLDLLDSFGELLESRSAFAAKLAALRQCVKELDSLAGTNAQRERELLEYQVAEIDSAKIEPGEDDTLQQEWQLLQRSQALQEGCYNAYNYLYADNNSAASLVHLAIKALRGMTVIDPSLQGQLDSLATTAAEIEETARDIREYAEAVELRAGRLEQVEERLELLRRLKSKYGQTLTEVMAFADRARIDLSDIESLEERKRMLGERVKQLEAEAAGMAEALSQARQDSARRLVDMVNGELADLGLPWAKFDISLRRDESLEGLPTAQGRFQCNQYGIDRLVFLGATNPGEPLKPLAEIASGGETSRFMLAVNTALRQAGSSSTLVFDEIDMGVGGRNAHVVGKKLSALGRDQQVICITHLPQIAAYADNHYHVRKEIASGRASTLIERLDGEARVKELAAMLGGSADRTMLESARELLTSASER